MKYTILVARPTEAPEEIRDDLMLVKLEEEDLGKAIKDAASKAKFADMDAGMHFKAMAQYRIMLIIEGWPNVLNPEEIVRATRKS